MRIANKTAVQTAVQAFATALRNDDGKLIKTATLDEVLGELIIDYNDGTTDIFPVVGQDGDPGDDGVSILDVQLVTDAEQDDKTFIQTTLSNGVILQSLNPINGYNGKSVTNAYIQDNTIYFELEGPENTVSIPVQGLEPGNIKSVRTEEGALIITLADDTELPPVSVDGIATNNPTGARIEEGDLIFILEDGTEISAGLVEDLKGRGVAKVEKREGVLYIEYDDNPGVEVSLGDQKGIQDIQITDGEMNIILDSGESVPIGKYMVFTGAEVRDSELILFTNQPGEESEINLGPVQNLKGEQGVGIKAVQIIDNAFVVTLTDDSQLPPLPVNELNPISVVSARYDETEGMLYLGLSDETEIATGITEDLKGRGVANVEYNQSTGEITITYDDVDATPTVIGTVPSVTNMQLAADGKLTVTWSHSPEEPELLGEIKSLLGIELNEEGQVVVKYNYGEDSNLGSLPGYKSAEITGGQLRLIKLDGTPELLGRVVGDKGEQGNSVYRAEINESGDLILYLDDEADTSLNAGPARTTVQNLLGRTQNVEVEAGQTEFAVQHGGEGTVLAFRNGQSIPDADLDLSVNDTIRYAKGADLTADDLMKFVIYVPGGPSETGRGVTDIQVNGSAYNVTLEDGTNFTIETHTDIDPDIIPPKLVSANVESNGDLILTFDKGDPINAGTASTAINTKTAVINEDGDLIITLDDDTEINTGSVVSDLTITNVVVNESGELIVTLNTGSEFNAGPTGVYVTNAEVDENDILQISLSDGRTLEAGSVRNPLLGSSHEFVAFEGQNEFPVAHEAYDVIFYANGIALSKAAFDLSNPNIVKTKVARKENDQIIVLLIGSGTSLAVGLESSTEAPNDTYYGKDENGVVDWHQANRLKFSQPVPFTATAGQSTVNVLSNGLVNVFKNGLMMTEGYSVPSDNRRIIFDPALEEGDKIIVEVLSTPASSADLLAGQYARIAYETFSPGGTFNSGSWEIRQMNKIVSDAIGVQLLNNRLILPAGQYYIRGHAACSGVLQNAVRLFNYTSSKELLLGPATFATRGNVGWDTPDHMSPISGYFTVESQSAILLQHKCVNRVSTYGFGTGTAGGRNNSTKIDALGIPGRLVDLEIWKVG